MLSVQEAIDKLKEMLKNPESITKSDLMEFAYEVSVADNKAPEGATTVLYSAMNGDVSFQSDDVRGIFHTDMWDVLESTEYKDAVAVAIQNENDGISPEALKKAVGDYLNQATDGPWAVASARFAAETEGEIFCYIGDIEFAKGRIWWESEMPEILKGDGVKSVNGIPRNELSALYREFNQSSAALDGICRAVGQAGVDNTNVNYLDGIIKYIDSDGNIVGADFSAVGGSAETIPTGAKALSIADERRLANAIGSDYTSLSGNERKGLLSVVDAVGDDVNNAVKILDATDGSTANAVKMLDAAKGDVDGAIDVLNKTDNNVGNAVKILNSTDGSADDAVRMLDAAKGDVDGAINVLNKTDNNVNNAARLLDIAENNADDALRMLDATGGKVDDVIKTLDNLGGSFNNADKIDILKGSQIFNNEGFKFADDLTSNSRLDIADILKEAGQNGSISDSLTMRALNNDALTSVRNVPADQFRNIYNAIGGADNLDAPTTINRALNDIPSTNIDENALLRNITTGKTNVIDAIDDVPSLPGRLNGARIGAALGILGTVGDVADVGITFYTTYQQYKNGDIEGASDTLGSWGMSTLGGIAAGAGAGIGIGVLVTAGLISGPIGWAAIFTAAIAGGILGKDLWDMFLDPLNDDYKRAGNAQPPRDPLVIDLGALGIDLTTLDDGVNFDLDKNGFAEKTAWIGVEDGFLVLDRDDNGKIDNGGELFGDQVELSNGTVSVSGFEALADLDENNDGVIDKNDSAWNNLKVWVDASQRGISESSELKTLSELGIASISLNVIEEGNINTETGTMEAEYAIVTFLDGTQRKISEFWFPVNTSDTTQTGGDGEIVETTGNVPDIALAIEADNTGKLAELYEKFCLSEDFVEKRILSKQILYFITDATDIIPNSRGGNIDARDLHVIETFMGREFVGVSGTTPNSSAANILKTLYTTIENMYFNNLNTDTNDSFYINSIFISEDEQGNQVVELSFLKTILEMEIADGENIDQLIYSIGSYLSIFDKAHNTNAFADFSTYCGAFSLHYANILELSKSGNTFLGTDRNDDFYGTNSTDFIIGEVGNDSLRGGNGNDIIYGGAGSDVLNGDAGDDTLYGEDDADTIYGGAGNDLIYGGEGDDTINTGTGSDTVYGEDGNDIINADTGDDIIYGGTGNDTVNAGIGNDIIYGEFGNDTINGDAGDDLIYGAEGEDTLDGGVGNDTIDAGKGNDIVYGGEGNDTLNGGEGDDTYYFNANHGNDIVNDTDGSNTLIFGDGLSADDYDLSFDISNGFVLINKETSETISLPDFIMNPQKYDFSFDGDVKVLGGGEAREVVEGTDEDDTLTAGDGFNIICGNGGNDTIEGGENLDFIFGGDGDDTINGGNGTNILHGEAGNDVLSDGEGNSYLNGGDGDDTFFAGAGDDILLGGEGIDEMHGEDGDDVLAGNDGDDILYGDAGVDTLYADAGNDTLYGGADDDSLFGGDGNDTLYGDAGNDYLESGNGNNTLYGGDGDDTLVSGEGTNHMYGGTGNDYFIGGNGDNYMYGEDGDDSLQGGDGYDYMEGGLGVDTLSGGNGFNDMFGQQGDDYIFGGNDNDYIDGGVGNDQLYGGNGRNQIYGQEGNDIIYDGNDGSYIYGGVGNDSIYAGGGNDVIDGGEGDDYIQDDHGDDTIIFKAGYGTDTISDAAGNNKIELSELSIEDAVMSRINRSDLKLSFGDDSIIIKQYFDGAGFQNFNINGTMINDLITTLHGSDDDDWMSAWSDNGVTINGEGGNDTLSGGNGDDVLEGGIGNDSLYGNSGNDTYIFSKGSGNDTIEDWNGSSIVKLTDINIDEVSISNSNDSMLILTVGSTGNTLTINGYKWNQGGYTFEFADGTTDTVNKDTWKWESGFDNTDGETTQPEEYLVNGTVNNDWLNATNNNGGAIYASDGNDGLNGSSGSDTLYGEAGDDTLNGNDGNDILDGGTGIDGLNGGNGEDTYIFAKGYGNDTVNEWGSDHSIISLTDINSDEVIISDQWGSNLVISVNGTEDTLIVSNFKWGQASFTFEFADGAIATVNKDTWALEFSQLPAIVTEAESVVPTSEDEVVQSNAELLTDIYADESSISDLLTETDATVISDVSDSVSVSDETDEVADQTDLQVMILTENMSAFSTEDNISDSATITDITDTSVMNQLLVGTQVQ